MQIRHVSSVYYSNYLEQKNCSVNTTFVFRVIARVVKSRKKSALKYLTVSNNNLNI